MSTKFPEYKKLDLSQINKEILEIWEKNKTFEKSIAKREGNASFVFYEGPPSANGMPGIHHVISRTIKDIFCRYKTLKGFIVKRKAGWDTHGLPVELEVEKLLGITKEDIGKKISIEEYNNICRKEVMKYADVWGDLTKKMGYWLNMDTPYITFDNRYIETIWYILKQLFNKELLYKGYSIQPYSPAAGTGLSSHELNLPGCYRDVKDTSCVAQFKIIKNEKSEILFKDIDLNPEKSKNNNNSKVFFLAWTTTPWTLPANSALAVGLNISYALVRTFNPYTFKLVYIILAKDLVGKYLNNKGKDISFADYKPGDKIIPYKVISEYKGEKFLRIQYEQLLPYVKPEKPAFWVISGDFVTTEEGTGIVHMAATFGADDYKGSKENNIGIILVKDENGNPSPIVDKKGRFVKEITDFAGRYVKNSYDANLTEEDDTLDLDIVVKLKKENKAFKIEKYVHSYPHCWRTDKPVLYYPLDSWFIKTTALKERLINLNNTINWQPPSTGTGRFGKWLENLVDWNLSRSRYWGTPIPIWVTKDKKEMICIGSVAELKNEIEKSVKAGFMENNPLRDFVEGVNTKENYDRFDLHRPFVDEIVLVSSGGMKMFREIDLIDVWFDSGAMPYAQMHYPFEHNEDFKEYFPADFIAEGVDQTRGWFFTLHAIGGMISDSVAFKNIISNGLVLDKTGAKMSKHLGNVIDPFKTIEKHGSDPLRWYLITNAQPWDNLKFDLNGIDEVKRKFFGTLYNTYSFFALYANVDGFKYEEDNIPIEKRPEIDRWIISLLNSLIKDVEEYYENYEPTKIGRAIQYFVIENLSNWYVRLNRKRFWGGEYSADKIAAYQTLYSCLETIAILGCPIVPFYMDKLFSDLNSIRRHYKEESVHLMDFPKYNSENIDKDLEKKMDIAQKISSMVLGLRRKVNIKVRQPLGKIMVPILNSEFKEKLDAVRKLILTEVNVKKIEYLKDTSEILVKKIKPNFKILGPKYGKQMKSIVAGINQFSREDIVKFENEETFEIKAGEETLKLTHEDVEIIYEDIPGWLVANEGQLIVALDIEITDELKEEGIAREFINRIQKERKDSNFDVTDKINIEIQKHEAINSAIEKHNDYIGSQTLASSINLVDSLEQKGAKLIEIDDKIKTRIKLRKL